MSSSCLRRIAAQRNVVSIQPRGSDRAVFTSTRATSTSTDRTLNLDSRQDSALSAVVLFEKRTANLDLRPTMSYSINALRLYVNKKRVQIIYTFRVPLRSLLFIKMGIFSLFRFSFATKLKRRVSVTRICYYKIHVFASLFSDLLFSLLHSLPARHTFALN